MQMIFASKRLVPALRTGSLEVMWHWINDYGVLHPTHTHPTPPGSEGKRLCVKTEREVVFYVQWLAFLDLIMSLGTKELLSSSLLKTFFPFLLFPLIFFLLRSSSFLTHPPHPQALSFSLSGNRHWIPFAFNMSSMHSQTLSSSNPSQSEPSTVVCVCERVKET